MSGAKLKQLKARKERLIKRFLKLQDQADTVNGLVYTVCCEVEKVNLEITQEEERLRKAAAKEMSRSPETGT